MTLRASKGQEASGSLCRTNDPKIRIRRDRLDGSNLEVRRQNVAQLSLRSSQCAAYTRSKMVSAQSLGHSACKTKRATQSQRKAPLEGERGYVSGHDQRGEGPRPAQSATGPRRHRDGLAATHG